MHFATCTLIIPCNSCMRMPLEPWGWARGVLVHRQCCMHDRHARWQGESPGAETASIDAGATE